MIRRIARDLTPPILWRLGKRAEITFRRPAQNNSWQRVTELKKAIEGSPDNPQLHHQLGQAYRAARRARAALTEFRTAIAFAGRYPAAQFLLAETYREGGLLAWARGEYERIVQCGGPGYDDYRERAQQGITKCQAQVDLCGGLTATQLWRLEYLPVDQYIRFRLVADRIPKQLVPDFFVLDVGAGGGAQHLFFPEARYVMADPEWNGISGTPLPFADNMFDVVVSTDAFEHVSLGSRELFLNELIRVAEKKVILVSPFSPDNPQWSYEPVYYSIAPSQSTLEHMQKGLPVLADVERFLTAEGISFLVSPYDFLPAHIWALLGDAYLASRPDKSDLYRVRAFCNTRYYEAMSTEPSIGYVIEMFVER